MIKNFFILSAMFLVLFALYIMLIWVSLIAQSDRLYIIARILAPITLFCSILFLTVSIVLKFNA